MEVCADRAEFLENVVIRPMGKDFEMGAAASGPVVPLLTAAGAPAGDTAAPPPDAAPAGSGSAVLYSFDFRIDDAIADSRAIKQALRDLRREVITVNGHILPPVHKLKELVGILRETLTSRPVKLRDVAIAGSATVRRGRSRRGRHGGGSRAPRPSGSDTGRTRSGGESTSDITAASGGPSSSDESGFSSDPTGLSDGSDTDFISSGNEGDTDGSVSRRQVEGGVAGERPQLAAAARKSKRRQFNVNALDIMTRRLLIAASRTGTGGDAYFVVRDLFGGEDVEVVTSEQSIPYGQMPRRVSDCTIELTVRLASIVIKCHSRFDVYPKALVRECEPLIQLYTTSTEVIQLQEVRADPPPVVGGTNGHGDGEGKDSGGGGDGGEGTNGGGDVPTVLVCQEKKTETTGQRIVSIRPAMYERVENWKTPS